MSSPAVRVTLVAAMGRNRVIGVDGDLPWRLPADLRAFRKATLGKPVIMGRKTWDSIGQALPGRENIVISRNRRLAPQGARCCPDLATALREVAASGAPEAMVIGGESLYKQALPLADELLLTLVHAEPAGDSFFPQYDEAEWQLVAREFRPADADNRYDLEFMRLRKIR